MNYKLGRVGIVVHDAYDEDTTYEVLDMLPYEGGLYIAKDTTTGNLPTETEYWVQVVPPTVTKAYVDAQDDALSGQIASLSQAVENGLAFDSKTITLPTYSSWSSYQYTIAVPGVTPTSTLWVSPDASSFINYSQYRIRCIAQGDGTLTFRYENSPSAATVVNVVIAN